MPLSDKEIKEMALVGLRHERTRIEESIQRLERELRLDGQLHTVKAAKRKRRRLSPEGRRNIVAALKKRWAAAKKGAAPVPGKRASRKAA